MSKESGHTSQVVASFSLCGLRLFVIKRICLSRHQKRESVNKISPDERPRGSCAVGVHARHDAARALPRGARVMLGKRGTLHPVPSASIQSTARTLACVRGEKERHAGVRQGVMEVAKR